MAFRVGVLRSCVAAGLLSLAVQAHAQSLDAAVGDTADVQDDGSTDIATDVTTPAPPPVPRLTIAPEDELPPPPRRKTNTSSYDATGLSVGGLRLFPAIEAGSVLSSNVKQSPDKARADFGLRVAPELRVESDWVRHSLRATIAGDYTAYAKNKKDNTGSVTANTDLRLDIRRTTFAEFSGGYTLTPVRPSDTGLAGGASSYRKDQNFNASAALNQDVGPVSLRLNSNVERKLYGSEDLVGGGTRDNKDLDLWRPGAGLRVTYNEPPLLKPYAEVNYSRRYHDKRDSSGLNTNSGDIDARLGVSFDDEALWSGDVALTYLRRDYSDKNLPKEQAFGVNGDIRWRPTELTTVVLGASTSLDDTSIKGRSYGMTAEVSQSVRENVTLRARGGLTFDKLAGGTDKTYEGGVGIDWQLTPEWALTAGYDATWLNAAQSDESYTEHRVTVGLVLRR